MENILSGKPWYSHSGFKKWIGDDMANQYIIGNCCILKFIYTHGKFEFLDMVDPTIDDVNK